MHERKIESRSAGDANTSRRLFFGKSLLVFVLARSAVANSKDFIVVDSSNISRGVDEVRFDRNMLLVKKLIVLDNKPGGAGLDNIASRIHPEVARIAAMKGRRWRRSDKSGGVPFSAFVRTTSNQTQAFEELLKFARVSGSLVYLDCDVTFDYPIDIDFEGKVLVLEFRGFRIFFDDCCLKLRNLAPTSSVSDANLCNITTPWVISRWNESGDWIRDPEAVLKTLKRSNSVGCYQPGPNDKDILFGLTLDQVEQNISPKLEIYTSSRVTLVRPKGRFVLYEFIDCQYCTVDCPAIEIGGKGKFGTIVWRNLSTKLYGIGNGIVNGGYVGYGTFSGVVFMRNRLGGVSGEFVSFRCGESGVKTYQNEVDGRSARCYEMNFKDILSIQACYDGYDFCSDYGKPIDRVDDFKLSEYSWHNLPTRHVVERIAASGCRGSNIWGDGTLNIYNDIHAENGDLSGVYILGFANLLVRPISINNNRLNQSVGVHQINIPGDSQIIDPECIVGRFITEGYAIYAPTSTVRSPRIARD